MRNVFHILHFGRPSLFLLVQVVQSHLALQEDLGARNAHLYLIHPRAEHRITVKNNNKTELYYPCREIELLSTALHIVVGRKCTEIIIRIYNKNKNNKNMRKKYIYIKI